jgi:hypothetical protein
MMIYHYTKSLSMASITANGLQPSPIHLAPGEKPVLWFTTNAHWENTVFIMDAPNLRLAHLKLTALNGMLVRIGCDDSVAPHGWVEMNEMASTPSRAVSSLYKSARKVYSDPRDWRGTLEVVPAEKFKVIEVFDGHAWVGDLPESWGEQTKAFGIYLRRPK